MIQKRWGFSPPPSPPARERGMPHGTSSATSDPRRDLEGPQAVFGRALKREDSVIETGVAI